MKNEKKDILRGLPSVDEVLRDTRVKRASSLHSARFMADAARAVLDETRAVILSGRKADFSLDSIAQAAVQRARDSLKPGFVRVINATGTVLHTNIGRAPLSQEACRAAALAAKGCINLELDLSTGQRGERDGSTEALIKTLTAAEAACVVNNNAAAVLIALNTLAEGKEVVISRGELIEIGGSFRLPEIIKKSGCALKEVGTTNRTHPKDYASAITADTAVVFKAHTSNYRVVGFTAGVGLEDLAGIARQRGLPVVEDLGSGALADLSAWGLPKEPLVSESIMAGADIVTFSGDKLLGGPQAGIIAGKKELVERIRKNPLKRALRADKMTLAALDATLRLYLNLDSLPQRLPVLRYLTRPLDEIGSVAIEAKKLLQAALGGSFTVEVEDGESVVGGGSLPDKNLPTKVISIAHGTQGPEEVFGMFLGSAPPILGRIKKDRFLLDLRTVDNAADVVPSGGK